MSIGDRIKSKRLELERTLEDVSKVVGVSRQTIQKYESGVITNIPSDKIELISKALNTTPAYLMGWEDSTESLNDILQNRIKELGISLEQVAEKADVSLQWLQNIDSFIPGEMDFEVYYTDPLPGMPLDWDDEIEVSGPESYGWISRVANVLGLSPSMLRAALARQEVPIPDDLPKVTAKEAFEDFTSERTEHDVKQSSDSSKEKEHLLKYRSLDDMGKHTVDTVLDMEYTRCQKSEISSSEETNNILDEADPDDENLKIALELGKEIQKSNRISKNLKKAK